uniref:Uncharacterized protein n=1 Tax=Arundo donax TaxID=35708 RepID=A0A0A9FYC2_ARUDO
MSYSFTTVSLDKVLHQMSKAFPLFSMWENMLHCIFQTFASIYTNSKKRKISYSNMQLSHKPNTIIF